MALVCRDCRAVHVLVLALASFNSLYTESEKVAPVSRRSWPQHTLMAGPEGPRGCLEGVVRMRAFGGDTPPPLSTQHGLSLAI